jgi:hypothetical protein
MIPVYQGSRCPSLYFNLFPSYTKTSHCYRFRPVMLWFELMRLTKEVAY